MPAQRRRAFTLVELLVVVAIVVLLVAILLPALSRARQQAVATQCASNLRQIVLAMAAYEADYKSYPYLENPCYGKVLGLYDIMLDKCWVDVLLERHYLVGPDLATRTQAVLACPAVDDAKRWTRTVHPSMLSRFITDYGYNWLANPAPAEANSLLFGPMSFRGQRGRMAKGDRKVLMIETWSWGGHWDPAHGIAEVWSEGHGWYAAAGGGWNSAVQHPNYDARHMGGNAVNVAYMAGNVELLYPPPPPEPPSTDHPLNGEHFCYNE